MEVNVVVNDDIFTAHFFDNASARALLEQMPLTLEMEDHLGQEKVDQLPNEGASTANERPSAIQGGDIYLWSG